MINTEPFCQDFEVAFLIMAAVAALNAHDRLLRWIVFGPFQGDRGLDESKEQGRRVRRVRKREGQ